MNFVADQNPLRSFLDVNQKPVLADAIDRDVLVYIHEREFMVGFDVVPRLVLTVSGFTSSSQLHIAPNNWTIA